MIFRREIGQASGRLGRVKYRDLELTFREDLRQAEALARTIPIANSGGASTPGRVLLEGDSTPGPTLGGAMIVAAMSTDTKTKGKPAPVPASPSPRESIFLAWDELGQALIQAAARLGGRRSPVPSDARRRGSLPHRPKLAERGRRAVVRRIVETPRSGRSTGWSVDCRRRGPEVRRRGFPSYGAGPVQILSHPGCPGWEDRPWHPIPLARIPEQEPENRSDFADVLAIA